MGDSFKTFEELECYQHSRRLRLSISKAAKGWPTGEKFRLVDQIIRSSRSVTANIAEGFGRHSHQENLQYCRQARGSLFETLEHLITAGDEGYLGSKELNEFRSQINAAAGLLNGYIAYLAKAASRP